MVCLQLDGSSFRVLFRLDLVGFEGESFVILLMACLLGEIEFGVFLVSICCIVRDRFEPWLLGFH